MAAGATAARVAERMAISLRTLHRWRQQFAGDGDGVDRRKGSARHVAHRLSQQERQQILAVCNETPFASQPPAQIVPPWPSRVSFWPLRAASTACSTSTGRCTPRTGQATAGTVACAPAAC